MDLSGGMDTHVDLSDTEPTSIPFIGMKFGSENEAYEFYNNYGDTVGFTVRRECAHKDKDDKTIIRSRRFVCNKAGTRGIDKRDKNVQKPRAETRVNCPAKLCISRTPNGDYVCREFVVDHNHELHTVATRHSMQSQRRVTDLQAHQIDTGDDVGIRPKSAVEYMGIQAGDTQNIGYAKAFLKNYLRTKRQTSLQFGEAGALSEYFSTQCELNPSFTHRLQYDSEEQVTNIFWADPRMLIDYVLFGDVVVFDTTFCTNKENRPLGVFSGFNHHRGVTIFGAALLYDETIDSFKWLFETFLEVHGHKKPKTIFTDQDTAMDNAIAAVMPETWHGLCTWHIMQNGIKNLTNLMKGDRSILKVFRRCMYEIDDVMKFEEAWQQMYNEHQISDNPWLSQMYGLKKKWARCYMRQTFTADVRSTQLSESINSDLKDYLRRTLNMKQFFTQFERVVADKRSNELKADFDARNTRPHMKGFISPILRHAARVYTPYIYSMFEEQFKWITSCLVNKDDDTSEVVQYRIKVVDEDGEVAEDEFEVGFVHSGPFVACNCRYFETFGILCTHALKVLEVMNITTIPEVYILPRWTRTVRSTIVKDTAGLRIVEDADIDCTRAFQIICSQFVKLSVQASTSAAGIRLAQNIADTFRSQLAALHIDSPLSKDSAQNVPHSTQLVLKRKEKHKGSSTRDKSWVDSWVDTMRKSRKKGNSSNQSSFDERESQQISQEMMTQTTTYGYQGTLNDNTYTGFLTGMHSSQGSSHNQTTSHTKNDGYYPTHSQSPQGNQSEFQDSQRNQSHFQDSQRMHSQLQHSSSIPDFLAQLHDRCSG